MAIVAANPLTFDSRFLHSARSLAEDGHQVTVLGWSDPGLPAEETRSPGIRIVRLPVDRRITGALRPLPRAVRATVARLIGLEPDITVLPPDRPTGWDRLRHPVRRALEVVANARRAGPWADMVIAAAPGTDVFHAQSLIALPVVRSGARLLHGRFVYDVADYHTEAARLARMPAIVRRVVGGRERRWARDAAGFLAVSDPVARLVQERWDVGRPGVVLNCPDPWRPDDIAPTSARLRVATGIDPDRRLVLYQGGFSIDRGIEELLAAAEQPTLRDLNVAVVFLGYGRLQGILDEAARQRPGRVFVLPPVQLDELLSWTAGADVSFVGQPPRTLNQRMNLPNKLFESLMAGVPVVVATRNEQCRLVTAEQVGRCANIDEPAAVAGAITELLSMSPEDRARLRRRCREVALARYTWDQNAGALVDLYRRLAAPPA